MSLAYPNKTPHQLLWCEPECFLVRHAPWCEPRLWLDSGRTLIGCPVVFITRRWLFFMSDIGQVNNIFKDVQILTLYYFLTGAWFGLASPVWHFPSLLSKAACSTIRNRILKKADSFFSFFIRSLIYWTTDTGEQVNSWIYRFGAAVPASPGEPPPPSFLGHLLLHDFVHCSLEQRTKTPTPTQTTQEKWKHLKTEAITDCKSTKSNRGMCLRVRMGKIKPVQVGEGQE